MNRVGRNAHASPALRTLVFPLSRSLGHLQGRLNYTVSTIIHRGYCNMAKQRYELYFGEVKTIFYEQVQ